MEHERERINEKMDRQLTVADSGGYYLPSTEVREVVPEFKDEIDLKDLIDTIIRRKSVVLACLLLCFSTVAIYTFTITPLFKAKGVLRVSSQSNNLTKFENIETSALKTMEFQQTQVKMMQSEQLASRVIDRMDLTNNPAFNGSSRTSSGEAQAKGLFDTIKSFIRPDENSDTFNMLTEDAQNQIIVDQALGKFSKQFSVSPIRNSELIDISFIASSVPDSKGPFGRSGSSPGRHDICQEKVLLARSRPETALFGNFVVRLRFSLVRGQAFPSPRLIFPLPLCRDGVDWVTSDGGVNEL